MPDIAGKDVAQAVLLLRPYKLDRIDRRSAYTDVALPSNTDDWIVCTQNHDKGEVITEPQKMTVLLHITDPGTPCPKLLGNPLHPAATHTPAPGIAPDPEASLARALAPGIARGGAGGRRPQLDAGR
ncbi:hypothetical protein AB0M92_15620 [Streptomyces sp. NPDC051582]|uniref:hypothetical protein n=1 Tax=Streptomyces sp. NPDC051582 TaxID=3155167 RepID=UPI0034297122